jgi:outer membrane receptor protein involved in Fe transport
MDFSKAHHYVISYDNQIAANWHIKAECYYQSLYSIPVTSNRKTNFSLVNMEDNYVIDVLSNKGKGKNYGIELSLERSWNDLFYLLATISLYQSKYLPSDDIWRDTRYNSNTAYTLLAGKEWMLGGKKSPSSFSLDIKMVQNGGVRVTPIDLIKSIQQRKTVFDNSRLYEEKLKNFFRLDAQAAWKIQFHKMTGSAIVGVQNLTDHKNPIQHSFDPATNSITYKYLLGRIPVFGFKIDL